MDRHELINAIKVIPFEPIASNLKFFKLLVSRLTEVDIPYDDALKIANNIEYDFSNIPEDNDSLSEVATEYADHCLKIYKQVKVHGFKDITPVVKYFGGFKLHIDHL